MRAVTSEVLSIWACVGSEQVQELQLCSWQSPALALSDSSCDGTATVTVAQTTSITATMDIYLILVLFAKLETEPPP
jgi:hypothetical protein